VSLFTSIQPFLPHHAITALVHRLARSERPWLRNALIRYVLAHYDIALEEALEPDPARYRSFNAFFTRRLRAGARPMPESLDAIASPCDGTVSTLGALSGEDILQAELSAKRHTYSLGALLAGREFAREYAGGQYACLYLAPRDYHRVHMPCDGRLTALVHVPGRLYSVNAASVAAIPGLFARNERLVCRFETPAGPMALIFVGALNVGSISLEGIGDITPRRARAASELALPAQRDYARGAELGRFNLGSTVILLFAPGRVRMRPALGPGSRVRVGEEIARITAGLRR
jgi:phosphatidylserine decarboxylase